MAGARHPKPYKDGNKEQVTIPWKRRVVAKLNYNKASGGSPANVDQLGAMLGAGKGGMNKLLDFKAPKPQLTSAHVKEITRILDITPPVLETDDDDDDFARDVLLLRSLDPLERRQLMVTAAKLKKRT